MNLTSHFDRAILFALEKHRTQIRKGSGIPYATHLMSVASLVAEFGGDEEQMIAGLLHDSMEDQGVQEEEIVSLFGTRVAKIVVACTDTTEDPKPPWKPRKVAYIEAIRHHDSDIKLVSACDKLHNATSIVRDLNNPGVGELIWKRFSASKEQSIWYYSSLRRIAGEELV
jgi:(p)ppGpp synthase/HD superfamily hydrolase